MDPPPRLVREHKFAGENGPRPEAGRPDFALKAQHLDLMGLLDEVGDGTDPSEGAALEFFSGGAKPMLQPGENFRLQAGPLPLAVCEVPAESASPAVFADVGAAAGAVYLLRPDGHVGLCGSRVDTDAMKRYFVQRLGIAAAKPAQEAPPTAGT